MGLHDGERESEQSWLEVLLDLKARGLAEPPKLAAGDGALGFWKALAKAFPGTRQQRCWVHKTANVLNKLPRGQQPHAKAKLHEMWMAATRAEALGGVRPVRADLPGQVRQGGGVPPEGPGGAARVLRLPGGALAAPADDQPDREHVRDGGTAGVHDQGGPGLREAGLAMVFKLAQQAQKRWRKLNGSTLLPEVIAGVQFVDGVKAKAA